MKWYTITFKSPPKLNECHNCKNNQNLNFFFFKFYYSWWNCCGQRRIRCNWPLLIQRCSTYRCQPVGPNQWDVNQTIKLRKNLCSWLWLDDWSNEIKILHNKISWLMNNYQLCEEIDCGKFWWLANPQSASISRDIWVFFNRGVNLGWIYHCISLFIKAKPRINGGFRSWEDNQV